MRREIPKSRAPFTSRAAILEAQTARLKELVKAILPANPFYARKISHLPVPADSLSLSLFSAQIPFTTKKELAADQQLNPPFGSNLTFPVRKYRRCHQTSGTSGSPLKWLDTQESWDWMVGNWTEVFAAAGVNTTDRIFFAFSFGPFIGFWLAFEAACQIGCLSFPGGGMGSAARLRAMLDLKSTVLCCTPTYAIRLAEVAAEEKIDLKQSHVRRLIVAGEPGGSIQSVRARLEELFPGSRVFDHHGMTEVGPVTYECPVRAGVLHVMEGAHLAEIVHPDSGFPVPSGQEGELILTPLGRFGSPLLRYRTGDLVKASADSIAGQPCACGRFEMALPGGILGRVDDMVVIRGVNIYPSAIDEIIRSCAQVAEYRVTIHNDQALAELRVEVEPVPNCPDPNLANRIEKALSSALALRIPVRLVNPDSLPRFELKAKRWIRNSP